MIKLLKLFQIVLKKTLVLHESIFNRNIFHVVVLLWLLFAANHYLINIDIYNNACIKDAVWYCRFDSRILLFIPELLVYWAMILAISAMSTLYKMKKDIVYPFSLLPVILIFFIILRIATLKEHDNQILAFGFEYYALIWEYFRNWIAILMTLLLLFTKEDFFEIKDLFSTPVKEEVKKEVIKVQENVETETYEAKIIRSIKSALPGILSRILAGNQFKKITYDSEGNFKSSMLTIKDVNFEADAEVFVELWVHIDLIDAIKDLSSYDWTLWINSNGKIEKFLSAKWRSVDGRNGLVIRVRENLIDMSEKISFPWLDEWKESFKNIFKKPLDFLVGVNKFWKNIVFDLADFPHLLVGWSNKTWKSVWMTSIIVSLMISRLLGHNLHFIIIDPKRVEFTLYKWLEGFNVITDMNKAVPTLSWVVAEMERRYELLERFKVKNIDEYINQWWNMSYIIVTIDEFWDLMTSDKEIARQVEKSIVLLAQKARAAWIHLIVATQNPINEIVTSKIKANLTSILWFKTSDSIKSRTVIDSEILAYIENKWECYLKYDSKTEHMKGFYIDLKELEKFIAYYKSETLKKELSYNDLDIQYDEILDEILVTNDFKEDLLKVEKHPQLEMFDSPVVLWDKYLSAIKKDNNIDPMDSVLRITWIIIQQNGYSNREAFRQLWAQFGFPARSMDDLWKALKNYGYLIYNEKLKSNTLNIELSLEEIDSLYQKIKETLWKTIS